MSTAYVPYVPSVLFLLCLALSPPCHAETTARDLLARAHELSQTTRKWNDRTQRLALAIVDRRGGERHREMVIHAKKYPEDRARTLLFFESPPEVKGVGFLQWADPHGKDEQWLYLPELKRVRQISGGTKRESFVGTDFSFEDLAIMAEVLDWSEQDAHAQLVRSELLDGRPCHVVELTPVGKDLAYGTLRVWMTADDLIIVKIEMYDTSAQLAKVLQMSDIRAVGAIPTAFHTEMRNVQSGSHTTVTLSEVKYDSGMGDDLFTQRALEHGP
jgi:outer membrane lipoprotein-sorting protein